MQHCPNNVSLRRWLVAGVAMATAAVTASAAAIQFSKPVVPIAMPEREQTDLPKPHSKALDLSGPQEMNVPIGPPPQMWQAPRRERDQDDENVGRHRFLDDPDDFPDAVGRDNARNGKNGKSSSSKKKNSRSQESASQRNGNEREQEQSLSPITDPNWNPRESDRDREERRRDPLLSGRPGKSERSDREESREKNPFETREENEQGQSDQAGLFHPGSSFESLGFRAKAAPTPAQLEQRAAFDELLSSGAGSIRAGGSLEPVTALEPLKPAAVIPMPMLGSPVPDRGPFAPSEAFNARPDRVRAPLMQDSPRKFTEPSKPIMAPAPAESPYQTPLMRQPTMHEIPARRF